MIRQQGLGSPAVSPGESEQVEPLRALAWAAVDAWLTADERLDGTMDDLRDYLKGKPEAIAKAEALIAAGFEG